MFVISLVLARTTRSPYRQITRLFASKHTNSYKTRATASDPSIEAVKPDPKKLELIEKLQLDECNLPTKKTGAELRKERKMVQHKTKVKTTTANTKTTSSYAAAQEKPVRFTLGCGVEALTATNLLELVKSTAPYLFPEVS